MKTKSKSPEMTGADSDSSSLRLENRVREQVLEVLGQPPGLQRMQVRKLWDGRYRANVFVGQDAASTSLVHSFFLVTDENGLVLRAYPEIERCY